MKAFLNVEIKAKCNDVDTVRNYLMNKGADFKGLDEQTDTYFNVMNGRLKLREGNIENNLIFYKRPNITGPKESHFTLVKIEDPKSLKEVLINSIGVKVIVKKRREIYYLQNVKFHIDSIEGLGTFIEIEAGNILANLSNEELYKQCKYYLEEFNIPVTDLIDWSYSDMLLTNRQID